MSVSSSRDCSTLIDPTQGFPDANIPSNTATLGVTFSSGQSVTDMTHRGIVLVSQFSGEDVNVSLSVGESDNLMVYQPLETLSSLSTEEIVEKHIELDALPPCATTSLNGVGEFHQNSEFPQLSHKSNRQSVELPVKADVDTVLSSQNPNSVKFNVNLEVDSVSGLVNMDNDMIQWQDGIGILPGSDLRFRVNEYGLTEILDDEEWQRMYDQSNALTQVITANKIEERPESREVGNGTNNEQHKHSICGQILQATSEKQANRRNEVNSLLTASQDGRNGLKCKTEESCSDFSSSCASNSHVDALEISSDNMKVVRSCLKIYNKTNDVKRSIEDLPGPNSVLQVKNLGFDLGKLQSVDDSTRPTTINLDLSTPINISVTDHKIIAKNEYSKTSNFDLETQAMDGNPVPCCDLNSLGVICPKPEMCVGDQKFEAKEVLNHNDNSDIKRAVSNAGKLFRIEVDDAQIPAVFVPVNQVPATDNHKKNGAKNAEENEHFQEFKPIHKIESHYSTNEIAQNSRVILENTKIAEYSETRSRTPGVPTPTVDLKPDVNNVNISSDIIKNQNCSNAQLQEVFNETKIKCESSDSDDSDPSSPVLTEEELPDIEPLPPVELPRIHTRSRSRSLSPMFHLPPPPPLENKSIEEITESSDRIPILKAETETYHDKDIAFCQCCGCFGLIHEFYESVFCTKACGDSYKYHLTSPDGKFKRPTPTTPKKSKLCVGGDGLIGRSGEVNPYSRTLVSEHGFSSDIGRPSKLLKKKAKGSPLKKNKSKQNVTANKVLQLKSLESRVEVVSKKKSRRAGGTKSTAFHSKDRKRNFPLVLSKRMPVSPERKGIESLCKDVQLSPDITLGKAKQTTPKMTTSSTMDFEWQKYLAETKSKTAPHRLFRQPAMPPENPFKPNMFLESIDPQHQSLICVAFVIETQGYRVRLRFEGFSEAYDYWVNADSLDIFPPGWCEENNLELQPPPGAPDPFNWHQYIVENRVQVAPRHIFAVTKEDFTMDSGVKPGMKMEAVDIRNQNLVCVATVAKVMGERILVHFDSWDSLYDYWTDLTSPYIHPVGWCEKNNVKLTPPNYCKPDFTWEKYLRDTNTIAMPSRLFRPLPPVGFRKGFKIECVDKRNPFLIRVATISEVDQHNLVIHFDNWPLIYDFKVYELSPDIHPVGWCAHTGHPLQPPPPADGSWKGPCTIVGCLGLGHIRGPKFLTHNSEKNCPYALHNYKKDWILADRITILERNYGQGHNDNSSSVESAPKAVELKPQVIPTPNNSKKDLKPLQQNPKLPVLPKSATIKRKRSSASLSKEVQQKKPKVTALPSPPRTPSPTIPVLVPMPISVHEPAESILAKKILAVSNNVVASQTEQMELKTIEKINHPAKIHPIPELSAPQGQHACVPNSCIPSASGSQNVIKATGNIPDQPRFSLPSASVASFPIGAPAETDGEYPPNFVSNAVPLNTVVGKLHEATVSSWRVEQLARFISMIPGCEHTANRFLDQLIDGESFMMLSQNDFISVMGLKLGPAIKLSNVIRMIGANSASTNYKPN